LSWQFITAQDIGGRAEQQDRYAVLDGQGGKSHLAIVADGVGGHGNGSLAAQTVIDVAKREFASVSADDPEEFLEQLCQNAHRKVCELDENAAGLCCSTCVFLLLRDSEAYWAHVGDSRLYLVRKNQIVLRTKDHSLVQLQADKGLAEEQKTASANQLYMCLGGEGDIVPSFGASRVEPDDLFLMCSDGLWGQLAVEGLVVELAKQQVTDRIAEEWVQKAKQHGGASGDNITLVMARLNRDAKPGIRALFGRLRQFLAAKP